MTRPPAALITGASGALAEHVVARFEAAGWRSALVTGRSGGTVAASGVRTFAADLSRPERAQAVVRQAEQELEGLEAVVNLAGGYGRVAAAETGIDHLRAMLERNLYTAVAASTAALPGMLRRGAGTLVCVAAAAAVDGAAGAAPYAASKAALAAYFRSLDREVSPLGVRALIVYPMGTLDTPANRADMPGADTGRWIDPRVLADALLQGVVAGPRGRLREVRVYPDG